MSVKITPTEANSYLVNHIEVYQDSENNWLSRRELTPEENTAFLNYIKPITEEKKSDATKKPFDLECPKAKLKKIDDTIEKINKQREILDTKEDLLSDESRTLRNFYHTQLNKYHDMRNEIINNISVEYKIVQANAPKPAI
jgi:hypothetical protein